MSLSLILNCLAFDPPPVPFLKGGHHENEIRLLFLTRGNGFGLYLTGEEAVLVLNKPVTTAASEPASVKLPESAVLRMQFLGANPEHAIGMWHFV